MTKIIFPAFCFFLLVSCGKKISSKESLIPAAEEERESDGIYLAFLLPVNGNVSNQVNGEVMVRRSGDDFKVSVKLSNAPSGIHRQFIHTGSSCPKMVQDKNNDGTISMNEARESVGDGLVPLDGDLSSQSAGSSIHPSGNFQYSKSTSYSLLLSDLLLPDTIPSDGLVKLSEGDLSLEQRVVMIRSKSPKGEVPVACGTLTLIKEYPFPE